MSHSFSNAVATSKVRQSGFNPIFMVKLSVEKDSQGTQGQLHLNYLNPWKNISRRETR
jgi:hypothetical protein